MAHWYLSFVKDKAFAGACFIEANLQHEAIAIAWSKGCNPGGEVMAIQIDYTDPTCTIQLKPEHFNRLFTRPELEELFGKTYTIKDVTVRVPIKIHQVS